MSQSRYWLFLCWSGTAPGVDVSQGRSWLSKPTTPFDQNHSLWYSLTATKCIWLTRNAGPNVTAKCNNHIHHMHGAALQAWHYIYELSAPNQLTACNTTRITSCLTLTRKILVGVDVDGEINWLSAVIVDDLFEIFTHLSDIALWTKNLYPIRTISRSLKNKFIFFFFLFFSKL